MSAISYTCINSPYPGLYLFLRWEGGGTGTCACVLAMVRGRMWSEGGVGAGCGVGGLGGCGGYGVGWIWGRVGYARRSQSYTVGQRTAL